MRLLLIHQNFPGQFRQLAPFLQENGHEVVAICSHQRSIGIRCRILRYTEPAKSNDYGFDIALSNEAFQRAKLVAQLCSQLQNEGWYPDCICAHTGWGETLGLRDVWPDVPQLLWPELWVRPLHGGYGYDPFLPAANLEHRLQHLSRNTLTAAALQHGDAWVMPTHHQSRSLPLSLQDHRLHIIHEGIDTQLAYPNPDVSYEVMGHSIDRTVPTITFVNRNLERLRGFDMFMRSLPYVLRNDSRVRILIVGDNEVGYGGAHVSGKPIRQVLQQELAQDIDWSRLHFLGRIPHSYLIGLMQASWVHVYLSYPFVLGWSALEAMACGCCIVGSTGMPLEEVIDDGVEGLLVPMDDSRLLAERILALLRCSDLRNELGRRARLKSLQWDQSHTLPRLLELIVKTARVQ